MKFTGKCSWFGGSKDSGVGPQEGLALVQETDLHNPWFARNFVETTLFNAHMGLARRLDPDAFYCAMRWDQVLDLDAEAANELARWSMVRVSFGEKHVWVQPVDYGPGDGSVIDGIVSDNTGRIIDLSPGALAAIGATTDDTVAVEVFE